MNRGTARDCRSRRKIGRRALSTIAQSYPQGTICGSIGAYGPGGTRSPAKFPVNIPVSREFGTESGSAETAPTAKINSVASHAGSFSEREIARRVPAFVPARARPCATRLPRAKPARRADSLNRERDARGAAAWRRFPRATRCDPHPSLACATLPHSFRYPRAAER